MTVFGDNLMVIGKECNAVARHIGTYGYGSDPVSLYETDDICALLNLPDKAYATFHAWFQIPGDMPGWNRDVMEVSFLEKKWKMPGAAGRRVPAGCKDLFSYLSRSYVKDLKSALRLRLFDLIYVAAKVNGLSLEEFVENTSVKW